MDVCLARLAALHAGGPLRVLEPSAGDGAFLRGLARSPLREAIACVTAIEPLALAAAQARRALRTGGLAGEVLARSAIPWAAGTEERFEAAVGNPPFVRYQFVSAADRAAAAALAARLGLRIHGVANLWIPVLLGALSRLRAGGAFAFVVPAEVLSGVAAGLVRSWLADSCRAVRLDSFPPGSFPGVLQEVMVLSGRRAPRAPGGLRLELVERRPGGGLVERAHRVAGGGAWTRYLLMREQVEALEAAAGGRHVEPLGAVATFEVSIVTGANPFFTLPDTGVARHNLSPWARPLLPRIRHAPGLRYTAADHARTRAAGARAWLLDLAAAPDPLAEPGPAAYLRAGEASGLPGRYKCRIREPWFRVPGIRAGELLLSKRSHRHPRVVLNAAGVLHDGHDLPRPRVLSRAARGRGRRGIPQLPHAARRGARGALLRRRRARARALGDRAAPAARGSRRGRRPGAAGRRRAPGRSRRRWSRPWTPGSPPAGSSSRTRCARWRRRASPWSPAGSSATAARRAARVPLAA